MNTQIVQLLKNISLDMNNLALEFEKQQLEFERQQDAINSKMNMLEHQTEQNRNALKAVANTILNQLD